MIGTKWPYWMRGGTIFGVVHVIGWVVTFLLSFSATDSISRAFAWFPLGLVDFLIVPLIKLGGSFGVSDTVSGAAMMFLILGTIQWFIVGAIIGWLYGKIKNRRSKLPVSGS